MVTSLLKRSNNKDDRPLEVNRLGTGKCESSIKIVKTEEMKTPLLFCLLTIVLPSCSSHNELTASLLFLDKTERKPTVGPIDVYSVNDKTKMPPKFTTIAYITLDENEQEFSDSTKNRVFMENATSIGADAVILVGMVQDTFLDRGGFTARMVRRAIAIAYDKNK